MKSLLLKIFACYLFIGSYLLVFAAGQFNDHRVYACLLMAVTALVESLFFFKEAKLAKKEKQERQELLTKCANN